MFSRRSAPEGTSRLARSLALVSVLAVAVGAPACAASEAGEEVAVESSELRDLTPDEILGEIHYGDTVEVAYTGTPWYRAYWFDGQKNDWLNIEVTSSTGDIRAFVTDDQYRQIRRGTRAVLPKTGRYFIVVREGEFQPATITIKFRRQPIRDAG